MEHVETTIYGTLTLNFSYIGLPAPNITWTLNGMPLDAISYNGLTFNSSMTGDVNTSILTWYNVPDNAEGKYSCKITNIVGSIHKVFNVEVKCKIDFVEFIVACNVYDIL